MSGIRGDIENLFERLGHWIFKNPIKTLALVFAFCAFFFAQVPSLGVDTSSEAMLKKDDPIRLAYNEFKNQFGKSEILVIAIRPKNVFDPVFLEKLRAFHEELEDKIPYVRKVTSLINIRNTRGEDDALIVEDLLENWPENGMTMAQLKQRVMNNPLYINHIISENGDVTAVLIETDAFADTDLQEEDIFSGFEEDAGLDNKDEERQYFTVEQNSEVVNAVTALSRQYQEPDFKVAISGRPIVLNTFNLATLHDVRFCVFLSIIVNSLLLAVLFRRASGVILPLIIVISSALCTLGAMSLLDVPFKMPTTVIPAFLVAVGLADSVHILAIFYRRLDQGDSKEDSIAFAMGHSGLAIAMTTLTTAAGLLSFSMAELTAIAEMGRFAAFGVMLALIFTIIMLPALLAFTPVRQKPKQARGLAMDKFLLWFAHISTKYPTRIIACSIVIMAVSVGFMFTLKFSDNIVNHFPKKMQVYKDVKIIDRDLKGTVSMEVVVDTGVENGTHDPKILASIEKISHEIEAIKTDGIYVGKVVSINNVVKETNQALHENDKEYYALPADRQTIAQELLLFENSGSDDLEKIVDNQFSKTRITIKTKWVDSVLFKKFIDEWKMRISKEFEGRADITITGVMSIMARTIPAALHSMAKSYVVAFVVITILMLVLVGEMRIGLVAMFPNLLPIALIMGIIGACLLPLNMNTLMIGSIAIGLVVDDTMHFIYNFRKYYYLSGDAKKAVEETMLGTGRALLITSLVLCCGFFTLLSGTLLHLVQFGFFTGLVIIAALLADFFLAPALMVLLVKTYKIRR